MFSYIHIPFCDNKCSYCRFASLGSLQDFQIKRYVKYLIKEIKNNNKKIDSLKSVYFGGGTPSVLKLDQLSTILKTLEDKYGFEKGIEITIESTPNNITKQNLSGWKKLGINRLSMGVQTLNSKSLEEIGRGNKGDIIEALNTIKEFGFKNVSLDFIIGLPFVASGEIKENIDFILKNYSFVMHISVYMLEEYYSPDKIIETKYDNITYPDNWNSMGIDEEKYLEEYSDIKSFLGKKGFNRYEISNYSKPGYECKHNNAYWNHSEVIAFGLGAGGFLDGFRYINSDSFKGYYAGETLFKDRLSSKDLFLEKVIFELRTSGLNKSIYKNLDKKKIDYFIKNNYLKLEEEKIKLKDKGVLVMDYILGKII